jgi:nitroreductase
MQIQEAIKNRHSVRQYRTDPVGIVKYNFEAASGHKCR